MTKKIKVLHIGHSPRWRGGENQVLLLIQTIDGLNVHIDHHLAYPTDAIIFDRVGSQSSGNVILPSGSPIDVRSIIRIIKYCQKNKIDIMHAHSGNAHTLAYYAKLFLPNIKLVVHRRVDNRIRDKYSTRRKFLSNRVDRFVAVSKAIFTIMKSYGIDENKISLVLDSIDNQVYKHYDKKKEKQKVINHFDWDLEVPLIGFISALNHQKNPELFVEIVHSLHKQGVAFNAVIAGDGKQTQSVKNLVERYGLNNCVKMLGFVKDVKPLFSALDIFVLPSRNEGLGTVLLEASSANAAIVASNVGGISEVVINEKTGLLVEPESCEPYVEAVKKLIEDQKYRNYLTEEAQSHVEKYFSLGEMALKTAELYRKIIN